MPAWKQLFWVNFIVQYVPSWPAVPATELDGQVFWLTYSGSSTIRSLNVAVTSLYKPPCWVLSNWLHVPYNYCATRPTDTSLASVPDPHTTQRQKAQRIQVVAWNLTVCQLLVQVTEVNYMANLIGKRNSLTVSISLQFLYSPPPTSGEWKNQSSLID